MSKWIIMIKEICDLTLTSWLYKSTKDEVVYCLLFQKSLRRQNCDKICLTKMCNDVHISFQITDSATNIAEAILTPTHKDWPKMCQNNFAEKTSSTSGEFHKEHRHRKTKEVFFCEMVTSRCRQVFMSWQTNAFGDVFRVCLHFESMFDGSTTYFKDCSCRNFGCVKISVTDNWKNSH